MKALLLSLSTAAALLATSGTAFAQHRHFYGNYGNYGGYGGYGGFSNYGSGFGHYHVVPAHLHYHATPFGGHYDYHGPSLQYHRGPDIIPLQSYGYLNRSGWGIRRW